MWYIHTYYTSRLTAFLIKKIAIRICTRVCCYIGTYITIVGRAVFGIFFGSGTRARARRHYQISTMDFRTNNEINLYQPELHAGRKNNKYPSPRLPPPPRILTISGCRFIRKLQRRGGARSITICKYYSAIRASIRRIIITHRGQVYLLLTDSGELIYIIIITFPTIHDGNIICSKMCLYVVFI